MYGLKMLFSWLRMLFSQGEWGLTEEMEEEERRRRVDFLKTVIPSTRAKMAVLAQSYQVSTTFLNPCCSAFLYV